ncbi:hypothetical protein [Limimaricola hongkongensis]|uniref:Tyr recombinase domain-containing protein n=2 Tax=Limimaricola hongkongensis TaxID=278132 RepID=A0A017HCE7_9RHOB|nr:hypothetical protein [Limimaricola hongkongensis]EYD72167.1 hypothetical protein Lokhon_00957 [Limimaricola hongkongensis DSM 17492]
MEHENLSPEEARRLLEHSLRDAQAKIAKQELLALADGAPNAAEAERRADLVSGHAHRLMAIRGQSARLGEQERQSLAREGLSEKECGAVAAHMDVLRDVYFSESWAGLIGRKAFDAIGRRNLSSLDLINARQIILKGRAAAYLESVASNASDDINPAITLAAEIRREATSVAYAPPCAVPATDHSTIPLQAQSEGKNEARTPEGPGNVSAIAKTNEGVLSNDLEYDSRIDAVCARLIDDKSRDGVDEKFQTQIMTAARILQQVTDIRDVRDLNHRHCARFRDSHHKLPKSWGKSPKDRELTVPQIIEAATHLPAEKKGLSAATINRNIGLLKQLLDRAESDGIPISSSIKLDKLRVRSHRRARDDRKPFSISEIRKVFEHPVWTGCRGSTRRLLPGEKVIKDGLFWVPLIAAYTGARRAEIAGLSIDDLRQDENGFWFFDIRFSNLRRLKNEASIRKVPVHSHLIELGLIELLNTQRKSKGAELFPDMRPKHAKGIYGDRLDRNWRRIVAQQLGNEENGNSPEQVFHSLRHYVINQLKRDPELKAGHEKDLVGHAGRDETEERYGDTLPISILRPAIERLPRVFGLD